MGTNPELEGIAIIGMAGRFPGAPSVGALWDNLCAGREGLSTFTDEELRASGVDPALLDEPNYVRSRGILEGVELFDAAFFGFTPRDAQLTDPQQRVFLECAWEALEDAGYDPTACPGSVGVFAGSSLNTYALAHIFREPQALAAFVRGFQVDGYNILVGNDKDYLATRVAYKFNLRGPAVSVQTACSTSLVAVCQASASLLAYQCDMALAGGVSISFPQRRGYLYQEGAIASADGHCRAFDERAAGTVFGAGCGVVVLKRLSEALADGDPVYAFIRGAALNNDGGAKVSFMAPSVEGQAEAVALAHGLAGVTADTITYVEAHGTGTPLGDPIEVTALTRAFAATTEKQQFCALGTVKTNLGHLEAAAGVTGLIKTALALQHGLIPPSLHFERPNPRIDFAHSPFFVVSKLTEWHSSPRRAGVSSFGVGGTNAHVVLEEAPPAEPPSPAPPLQLVALSAKSPQALEQACGNLAAWLRAREAKTSAPGATPAEPAAAGPAAERHSAAEGDSSLFADVAFTLQVGRHAFDHRCALVAASTVEAAKLLEQRVRSGMGGVPASPPGAAVVFMFPGQASQHVQMGRELCQTEPLFREQLDYCSEALRPHLGLDLRSLLYPPAGQEENARAQLAQTEITQPALFVIEYALARLWQSWGVQPAALVGHSIGEYVAAVIADVMTLDDALSLVARRGQLMQALPPGAMLAVRLSEPELLPLLGPELTVAVVNSPKTCVVSGPTPAIEALEALLAQREVGCQVLRTSHAFHSPMMEPIVAPFADEVKRLTLRPARVPVVSTLTGTWVEAAAWTEPDYWARQLRQPVRFAAAVATLCADPSRVLLEVGPSQALTKLALQHPARPAGQLVVPSFPPAEKGGELRSLLDALARLWTAGVGVDWRGFHGRGKRRRVPLPTYPFERQRYWLEPGATPSATGPGPAHAPAAMDTLGGSAERHAEARVLQAPGGPELSPGSVEQLITEQLRVMSEQLEALTKLQNDLHPEEDQTQRA